MSRYAVAYANADGDCVVEIVNASSPLDAVAAHSRIGSEFLQTVEDLCLKNADLPKDDDLDVEPEVDITIEDAQEVAGDQDFSFDVVEIK
jgi:hypothetical protein